MDQMKKSLSNQRSALDLLKVYYHVVQIFSI